MPARPPLSGAALDAALDAATIPALRELMDSGQLTAVDLARAYLQRIETLDGELGAVLLVNPRALDEAAASDRHRASNGARGPLEGIPVLVKDNIGTAGLPTTAGSRALRDSTPDDATVVRRLRAAGGIVLGKANLSEWANFRSETSTSGWSAVGGQTANPYALDSNPCGSSSGSGTGIAAALAQVAIGTETDGSIVCPAGVNGIVGMKPTLGVVSRAGIVPISAEQDTAGPMARHVVDAALLLDVMAGPDPADPATMTMAGDRRAPYADALDADSLSGARIGVWTPTAEQSEAVGDDAAAVLTQAVRVIEAAGATAVPVELADQDELGEQEMAALVPEFKRDLGAYLAEAPGEHPRTLAELIAFNQREPVELSLFGQDLLERAEGAALPADDPAARAARETARRLARACLDAVLVDWPAARLDAVMALTNAPAWPTRYHAVDGKDERSSFGSSSPAAVAGYPNITVPAGFAGPQGALPVGVSFIGAHGDDAQVLSLAYAFETAAQARRPPGYLRALPATA